MSQATFEVRAMLPEDQAFFYATWLQSYARGSYFARKIPGRVYFPAHHAVIEALLGRSRALVAHPPGELQVILGYCVFEALSPNGPSGDTDSPPGCLHWVYVKKAFRRYGIASRLVKESGMSLDYARFSHWTYDLDALLAKLPGLVYDPYAALTPSVKAPNQTRSNRVNGQLSPNGPSGDTDSFPERTGP